MPEVKSINKHFTLADLESPANQMTWEMTWETLITLRTADFCDA